MFVTQRYTMALVCLSAIAFGTSCIPMDNGGTTGGGGSSTCGGSFGASQSAAKISAFVSAANDFSVAAAAAEAETVQACQRMGRALGMSAGELSGSGTDGMRTVCAAVNQRLSSEMQALRQLNVQVSIMARPPQCQVSVNAYATCAAHCDASVDPGSIEMQCQGGELRGSCDAQCTGSCAVDVSGSCSGRCEGMCNGQCSATNADGSCAGTCNGSCSGHCVASAQASCQGECRGGCSVQYREPYCTGNVTPPRVSAECDGYCDAHAEASAHCEPGQVDVGISGLGADGQAARVARIRAAATEGLASIVSLRVRLQRLQSAAGVLVRLGPGVPRAAVNVGVSAVSCATAAAASTARAMASVHVSLEVNVQMSASISGSAG